MVFKHESFHFSSFCFQQCCDYLSRLIIQCYLEKTPLSLKIFFLSEKFQIYKKIAQEEQTVPIYPHPPTQLPPLLTSWVNTVHLLQLDPTVFSFLYMTFLDPCSYLLFAIVFPPKGQWLFMRNQKNYDYKSGLQHLAAWVCIPALHLAAM